MTDEDRRAERINWSASVLSAFPAASAAPHL
jgi:hypothetical protein